MHLHQEATLGKFFGRLGDGIVTKMYRRDIRAGFENLEILLESGEA